MSRSASLLTQTQRNRIRDDFDELDVTKKRRDQGRIRERIESGIFDFRLLVDYPDRQFELAFDDVPEDELLTALADTHLVVERLRELHGYERAELIEGARSRTDDMSDMRGIESIQRIDLRTSAEIRRRAEADVEEQYEGSRWDRRSNRLAKLAMSAFVPVLLVIVLGAVPLGVPDGLQLLYAFFFAIFAVSFLGWVLIMAAKVLKYDILPALVKLLRHPDEVARQAFEKLIKNPGRTIRESWDEL